MKLSLKTAFIAGLSLLALSQFTAYAQAQAPTPNAPAAPAPGAEVPNRVNGAVSAVTATTITIHDRRTDSDIPVAVTPDTVYLKTVTGSVTEIAAGDIVMAGGREELAAGATSLDAARINILPELPKVNRPNTRGIIGTVVTATPSQHR